MYSLVYIYTYSIADHCQISIFILDTFVYMYRLLMNYQSSHSFVLSEQVHVYTKTSDKKLFSSLFFFLDVELFIFHFEITFISTHTISLSVIFFFCISHIICSLFFSPNQSTKCTPSSAHQAKECRIHGFGIVCCKPTFFR